MSGDEAVALSEEELELRVEDNLEQPSSMEEDLDTSGHYKTQELSDDEAPGDDLREEMTLLGESIPCPYCDSVLEPEFDYRCPNCDHEDSVQAKVFKLAGISILLAGIFCIFIVAFLAFVALVVGKIMMEML